MNFVRSVPDAADLARYFAPRTRAYLKQRPASNKARLRKLVERFSGVVGAPGRVTELHSMPSRCTFFFVRRVDRGDAPDTISATFRGFIGFIEFAGLRDAELLRDDAVAQTVLRDHGRWATPVVEDP